MAFVFAMSTIFPCTNYYIDFYSLIQSRAIRATTLRTRITQASERVQRCMLQLLEVDRHCKRTDERLAERCRESGNSAAASNE